MKKIFLKLKKSVWLYPALISVLSFFLALIVVFLDGGYLINLELYLPDIFLTSIDLSKTILTVIAGSLITMTTFTFSTTMVVLTTYSSQLSPRTVENFLEDDVTMKALGVFMGGFVYAMMTLLFMRTALGDRLVVAATLGIGYSIVCLAQFTMYIHHVGSYIQINNLIWRIFKGTEKRIEDYRNLLEKGEIFTEPKIPPKNFKLHVASNKNGYIQLVSHEKIAKTARDLNAIIILEKVIGQFVSDSTNIFTLIFEEKRELEEDEISRLQNCVAIGYEKTEWQDFNFSIQKIVEIALRAISPGVNDPNTANHCLKMIGILLAQLADLKNGYLIINEDEEEFAQAVFEAIDFEKELHFILDQVVHYGKSDVSVIISVLKALRFAMEKATLENRKAIVIFVDYIFEKIETEIRNEYDQGILEHERREILALV